MNVLKVILSSLSSLGVLFLLAKLIGNRQMSQLTLFDYINGITIGSIAAEMATELEKSPLYPIVAMVIYGAATALISFVCCKSQRARRFFNGHTAVLFKNGSFIRKNFSKAHLDVNEFMTQCRINGCFDLSELDTAIMEQNGRISFYLKAYARPVTVGDMGLSVSVGAVPVTVVLDGKILDRNLYGAGYDERWLSQKMKEALVADIKDVMLATVDSGGKAVFYGNADVTNENDIFM